MAAAKRGKPKGPNRNKPFAEALRMEYLLAEKGEPTPAPEGSLRWVARQSLIRAGAETAAMVAIADRLDGKPASNTIFDGDDGPTEIIIRKMKYPEDDE